VRWGIPEPIAIPTSPGRRSRDGHPLPPKGRRGKNWRLADVAIAVAVLLGAGPRIATADEASALYSVYWAGLPAGDIKLTLRDDPAGYRDEIEIRTEGLPRLVTRFRGSAASGGRLVADHLPQPAYYDAHYDLRKGKNRRLSMRFIARASAAVAERGPEDTSKKPPLAESFRQNVLDPLSTLTAIRDALRRGNRGDFSVPVYDGARRFDVKVRVLPKKGADPALHLELTLAPIAGFKGETSEDGDPDDAPRPVDLTLSDDARLMPLSMSVSLYYLPLAVQLTKWCVATQPCGW
jgi:hypothetical protein